MLGHTPVMSSVTQERFRENIQGMPALIDAARRMVCQHCTRWSCGHPHEQALEAVVASGKTKSIVLRIPVLIALIMCMQARGAEALSIPILITGAALAYARFTCASR